MRSLRKRLFAASVFSALLVLCAAGAQAASISGQILDLPSTAGAATDRPVAQATVIVSPTLIVGATAPPTLPSGAVAAETNADGTYTLGRLPALAPSPTRAHTSGAYVMVFAPGYVAYHGFKPLGRGDNALGVLHVTRPTAQETAWLARVNADREANRVFPVVFDEIAIESARRWASYMARTGYFGHECPSDEPSCTHRWDFENTLGAIGKTSENIAAGFDSWALAESGFMAERAKCPNGNLNGCAFSEATGHVLNLLSPEARWVGLATLANGRSFDRTYAGSMPYYAQEFVAPPVIGGSLAER